MVAFHKLTSVSTPLKAILLRLIKIVQVVENFSPAIRYIWTACIKLLHYDWKKLTNLKKGTVIPYIQGYGGDLVGAQGAAAYGVGADIRADPIGV